MPIAIQLILVFVAVVLVKNISQPSFVTPETLAPVTFVPGSDVTGVTFTEGITENDFGNVKCISVGTLAVGVKSIRPTCIESPPKAEFCT